jgi:hypothetical protein
MLLYEDFPRITVFAWSARWTSLNHCGWRLSALSHRKHQKEAGWHGGSVWRHHWNSFITCSPSGFQLRVAASNSNRVLMAAARLTGLYWFVANNPYGAVFPCKQIPALWSFTYMLSLWLLNISWRINPYSILKAQGPLPTCIGKWGRGLAREGVGDMTQKREEVDWTQRSVHEWLSCARV